MKDVDKSENLLKTVSTLEEQKENLIDRLRKLSEKKILQNRSPRKKNKEGERSKRFKYEKRPCLVLEGIGCIFTTAKMNYVRNMYAAKRRAFLHFDSKGKFAIKALKNSKLQNTLLTQKIGVMTERLNEVQNVATELSEINRNKQIKLEKAHKLLRKEKEEKATLVQYIQKLSSKLFLIEKGEGISELNMKELKELESIYSECMDRVKNEKARRESNIKLKKMKQTLGNIQKLQKEIKPSLVGNNQKVLLQRLNKEISDLDLSASPISHSKTTFNSNLVSRPIYLLSKNSFETGPEISKITNIVNTYQKSLDKSDTKNISSSINEGSALYSSILEEKSMGTKCTEIPLNLADRSEFVNLWRLNQNIEETDQIVNEDNRLLNELYREETETLAFTDRTSEFSSSSPNKRDLLPKTPTTPDTKSLSNPDSPIKREIIWRGKEENIKEENNSEIVCNISRLSESNNSNSQYELDDKIVNDILSIDNNFQEKYSSYGKSSRHTRSGIQSSCFEFGIEESEGLGGMNHLPNISTNYPPYSSLIHKPDEDIASHAHVTLIDSPWNKENNQYITDRPHKLPRQFSPDRTENVSININIGPSLYMKNSAMNNNNNNQIYNKSGRNENVTNDTNELNELNEPNMRNEINTNKSNENKYPSEGITKNFNTMATAYLENHKRKLLKMNPVLSKNLERGRTKMKEPTLSIGSQKSKTERDCSKEKSFNSTDKLVNHGKTKNTSSFKSKTPRK